MHALRRLPAPLPFLLLIVLAAAMFAGCGDDDGDSGGDGGGSDTAAEAESDDSDSEGSGGGGVSEDVAARDGSYDEAPTERLDPDAKYVVRMTTNKGAFDIAVDQGAGPIAAANFVFLVKEGYYDGTVFHRVIKDFMIQGGDPLGTGTGGPGYTIEDDPVTQPYEVGTVAMARTQEPNSGGSQFFIIHGAQGTSLPQDYVIFGKVDDEGMKVVDEIANVETEVGGDGAPSAPVDPIIIEQAELVEGA